MTAAGDGPADLRAGTHAMVFGSATSRTEMRFGWRHRIYVAPAPHVDGDPFWGSARSRRPGASARRLGRLRLRYPAIMTAE